MAALSLAFDILARDQGATRTLNNVGDSADRAGKAGTRFGSAMKAGIGLAVGAIATLGLGSVFRTFIDEANEAAKVGRLTNAVVESTGGVAKVSAAQVADLAEALSVKAGVDDELVQSGANVLLTFTNIRNEAGKGNKVFDYATEAALNMSAALGTDLQSSVTMIGKALNDPIKGTTALGKAGIQFTADQKEQIKALTETGDLLGAQKIILGELQTQFGGAAEAAASPLDKLKVSAGNLGEAIGGILLPGAGNLADFLTTKVIPVVQGFIEDFAAGEGTAGKFKDALVTVRDAAKGIFDILFKGDFTGGIFGLEEDSGVVSALFTLRDAAMDFADAVRWLWTEGKKAADILATGLKPVWDELVAVWNSDLKPAFEELLAVIRDEFGPLFEDATGKQGSFIEQSARMTVLLAKELLPTVIGGIKVFAEFVRGVAAVVGPLKDAYVWSINLATQVRNTVVQVQLFVSKSVAAVQNLAATFRQKFLEIREGVAGAMVAVISTVRGIPGQVTGALGNLGNLLRNAGRQLIQGLIGGITDRLAAVRSAMQKVAQTIGNFLPGSPVKDGPLVKWNDGKAGRRLVDMGIIRPLNAATGSVSAAMNGVAGSIAMPSGPKAGPGRPIVVQSYLDGRLVAESVNTRLGDMAERSVYA